MTNSNIFSEILGNLRKNSKYVSFFICFSIGFAVVVWVGTLFNTSDTFLVFENVDKSEMSNLLIALLFIAWMLESFLEILLKTFKLDESGGNNSSEVARFTAIAGFIIGLIIAWSGVHTLGVFFEFRGEAELIEKLLFGSVDAILTAGVIAGGSKGVHELTNAYKQFVQAVKERAT